MNNPRILLIGPTALDMQGNPIKQRRLHLPGLTLPMLAAVTPEHCSVRLINETVEEIPYDEAYDLVGITGMGSGIVRGWQIGDEFRRRGVKVVIGGIAASLADPDWTLKHADTLVIGEAEDIWPEVVRDFEAGEMKPIYKMRQPPEIKSLPKPRYDLMNKSKLGVWRPVQATRGCPFTCSFCSITSFFKGRYRKRPIDQVIRDVRSAKRSGSRYIAMIDDNIGVDWDYAAGLFEALIPENIIWMSQCSLHIAEVPEMLKLAHRSGCRLLSFGIESISETSLAQINKEWNAPSRYYSAVETIRAHGIDVSTEMMIGLDGDDASVFERTYEFITQAKISVPRVHILTPIPGTPLYDQLSKEGRMISHDFDRYSGGQVVYQPRNISPDDLQRGYWNLYERLFTWPNIFHRLKGNRAGLSLFMRAVVLAINLHYRGHIQRRITPGIV